MLTLIGFGTGAAMVLMLLDLWLWWQGGPWWCALAAAACAVGIVLGVDLWMSERRWRRSVGVRRGAHRP